MVNNLMMMQPTLVKTLKHKQNLQKVDECVTRNPIELKYAVNITEITICWNNAIILSLKKDHLVYFIS